MTEENDEAAMGPEPGTVRKILDLLTPRERRTGILVLCMMMVLAVLETLGVASVMPFLAVLGNPELVETQPALAWAYEWGGFESVDRFLFVLGVGAFALVLVSAGFRILTTYAINRWAEMRRYSIGARLLSIYLRQPYEFFLSRNSADLSKSILSEVDELVLRVFRPGMNVLAYSLVVLVLIGFLVWLDPLVSLLVAAVVGGVYVVVYLTVRGLLGRMGENRIRANRERFTAASEALGGIKDLKVLGREGAYLRRFRGPASQFAQSQALTATIATVPKYLIEAVGLGGVLLLALVLLGGGGDLGAVLPLLGVYTFAGYRILPAAQQIYSGASLLRFGLPAVDDAWREIQLQATAEPAVLSGARLELRQEIRFESVSFRYPGGDRDVLRDVTLAITAGDTVAFVGETGAGKTTALDLLLGVMRPTAGFITIDGQVLEGERVRMWQDNIGYVPQIIYLADATIAENIAFGVPVDAIDRTAVERAGRMAMIHDFVTDELHLGYDTVVGEHGVRLSGGQRQRIGIARALYHDPQVLVLDEATSALDGATERAVMEALEAFSGSKTIVGIAHREATIARFSKTLEVGGGRVLTTRSAGARGCG